MVIHYGDDSNYTAGV